MANPTIYTEALNKFRAEYNLPDYDLEKEIAADNVTRFFNNKSIGASAQQYERLAANAALKYFESSTTFQEKGSQQLKGFDHSKFIADFEALMQARYDSKLEDGVEAEKRTPFDGSDKEKLKIAINASANKVNKPLAELWADKLKSGTYKFKDLNSTVATQSSILFTANEKTEEHVRIFRDLVASREAVRELRASRKGIRGFFWRLFNREQNKQEKDLLASLDSQINQLGELKGYDVNSALHDATNVTTWGKDLFERSNAVDLSIDKREPEKFPINVEEEQVSENKEKVSENKEEVKEEYGYSYEIDDYVELDPDRVKEWEQIQAENQRKIDELSVRIEQIEPSHALKFERMLEQPPVKRSADSTTPYTNWLEERKQFFNFPMHDKLEDIIYPSVTDKNDMSLTQIENVEKVHISMRLPFQYICEDAENPNMTPEEFHKNVHQHLSSAFSIIIGRLNTIAGEEADIKQNFINAAKIFELGFKAYAPKEAFPDGSYEKYANDYILNLDIVEANFQKYEEFFESKNDLPEFIGYVKEALDSERNYDKNKLANEQKEIKEQYDKEQARIKALIAEERRQRAEAEQRREEDFKILREKRHLKVQKQIEAYNRRKSEKKEQKRLQKEMEELKLQDTQANAEKLIDLEFELKEKEINSKFEYLNSEELKAIPEGKTLANKNLLKFGYIPRVETVQKDREELNKIADYLNDFKQPVVSSAYGLAAYRDYVNSKGEKMDFFTHYLLTDIVDLNDAKIKNVERSAENIDILTKSYALKSNRMRVVVEQKQWIKNDIDKWEKSAEYRLSELNRFRNDKAKREYDRRMYEITWRIEDKDIFIDPELLKERYEKCFQERMEKETQWFKEHDREMFESDIEEFKVVARQRALRELRSEKRQQLRNEATEKYNKQDKEFFPEIKIPNLLLPEEKKVELNQQENIEADDRKEFVNKLGEDVNGKDVSNKSEKVETKDNPTLESVKE